MKDILIYYYSHYKKFATVYFLLKVLALVCQVAGLLLVIAYVSTLLGRGSKLSFITVHIYNYSHELFLYSFPILTALVIFLGYLTSYKARCIAVRMMVDKEKEIIDEYLGKISSTKFFPDTGIFKKDSIVRIFSSDVRYLCRMIAVLMDVSIPCITILIILSILLWIQPLLTSFIIFCASIFSIYFIKYSRRIAQIVKMSSPLSTVNLKFRRGLLDLSLAHSIEAKEFRVKVGSMNSAPEVNDFLENYGDRLKTNDTLLLFIGGFLAIVLSSLSFYVGMNIVNERDVLQNAIIYIVGVNYSLLQLRRLTGSITKIRFFQKSSERCLKFLSKLDSLSAQSPVPSKQYIIDHLKDFEDIIGVIVPDLRTLNKQTLYSVLHELGLEKICRKCDFVTSLKDAGVLKASCSHKSLIVEYLNIVSDNQKIQQKLLDEWEVLEEDNFSQKTWDSISSFGKILFQLPDSKDNSVLLVDASLFSGVDDLNKKRIKDFFLRRKIKVIIVYFRQVKVSVFGEPILLDKSKNNDTGSIQEEDDLDMLTLFDD